MIEPHQKIISVRIDAKDEELFPASRTAAVEAVEEVEKSVFLISWKNNRTGESSPKVGSCRCDIEGWELYALSRGATLRVEINGGEVIFLFAPLAEELTAF